MLSLFVILGIVFLYVVKSKVSYFYVLRIYAILEYSLFAIFLYNCYKSHIAKKIIVYSIIPFFLISIIDYFVSKSSYSNYPSLFEFLLFIVFLIFFFYEKMNTIVSYPIYQSITFWICVGLFLYFSGNFFFFLFNTSSNDKNFTHQMRIVYSIVTISKNILLSLAFLAHEQIESNEESFNIPNELNLDSFNPKNNLN